MATSVEKKSLVLANLEKNGVRYAEKEIARKIVVKPFTVEDLEASCGRERKDVINRISDLRRNLADKFSVVTMRKGDVIAYYITETANVRENDVIIYRSNKFRKVNDNLFVC